MKRRLARLILALLLIVVASPYYIVPIPTPGPGILLWWQQVADDPTPLPGDGNVVDSNNRRGVPASLARRNVNHRRAGDFHWRRA